MTTTTKPRQRTIAEILKKRTPCAPQPCRAAVPLAYKHVGFEGGRPVYELHAVCDDGQARWFVLDKNGRWTLRKEQPHAAE